MTEFARMCLGITVVLGVAAAVPIDANCNTYQDSMIVYYAGQAYCGGSGSGCTECTGANGGSCVTNGSSCTLDPVP